MGMLLVHFGMPLEDVLAMDMHAFVSAYHSAVRVLNAKRVEDAWTAMHAAQGSDKGMKKWLARYDEPGKAAKAASTAQAKGFFGSLTRK